MVIPPAPLQFILFECYRSIKSAIGPSATSSLLALQVLPVNLIKLGAMMNPPAPVPFFLAAGAYLCPNKIAYVFKCAFFSDETWMDMRLNAFYARPRAWRKGPNSIRIKLRAHLCMYLCMYVCTYLSVYLYVCMYVSMYLSFYLSIYLSMNLSIYLSIPISI